MVSAKKIIKNKTGIMKKLVVSFALALVALVTYAQSNSEHLSFKGIPIKGSLTEFCEKLQTKGYKYEGKDSNMAMFTGDFTGRDATIGVSADDNGQNVYAVIVVFDSSGKWKILANTYSYYKDLYTKKYGKPFISTENNPAESDSNMDLMSELYHDNVQWSSVWVVTGGTINLGIMGDYGSFQGHVSILYRDSQNEESKEKKYLEDI